MSRSTCPKRTELGTMGKNLQVLRVSYYKMVKHQKSPSVTGMGKNLEALQQAVDAKIEQERSEFARPDDSTRQDVQAKIMSILNADSDLDYDDDYCDKEPMSVGVLCTLEDAISARILDLNEKVIIALGVAVEMGKNPDLAVDLKPSTIILDEQHRPVLKSGLKERCENKMHVFGCTMYEMMTNRSSNSRSELRFPAQFSSDLKKVIKKAINEQYKNFKELEEDIISKLPLIGVKAKDIKKYYNEVRQPTSRIVVSMAEIERMIPEGCESLVEQHNHMVEKIDFKEYKPAALSRSEFLDVFEELL